MKLALNLKIYQKEHTQWDTDTWQGIGIYKVNLCWKHLLTYVMRCKANKAKGNMILYQQCIYICSSKFVTSWPVKYAEQ